MSDWEMREFSLIAKPSKKKFNPKMEKKNSICVELEHISKETGRLLGSTSSNLQQSMKNVFQKENVLFGKLRPNLRKYIYCNFDGVCSSEIWVLLPEEDIYPKFLFYLVQQEKFITSSCVVSGSKMPRASWDYVSKIPFAVPSLPEQKAIADLLSTWDTAIEKTEALITAKQQQFYWLVNELINNSNENWSLSALENIAKIRKGKQKNRDTLEKSGEYPVWNGGITPSGYTDQRNTVENTITISEGGNSCGFVNFCKEEFWLGGHCYALEEIISKISPIFLFFLLKAQERYIMSLRIGSGLPNIQMKSIKKIEIKYPNLQKQKRIAKILNTAKQEIDSLKSLTKQYRTQKRGLMQKLLTGKSRIKPKTINQHKEV